MTLITFKKAKELNLKGREVKLEMETVRGDTVSVDSAIYKVRVKNQIGDLVEIEAYGIARISSKVNRVNFEKIVEIFQMDPNSLNRPCDGDIDMLIGQQVAALHPVRCKAVGNLILMKNEFGFVVSGSHSHIKTNAAITSSCLQARNAKVMYVSGKIESFFDIEALGVTCEPKCGGCKCGHCHPGGKNMSLKDEREYQLIEKGLQYDENRGRWLASYPWVKSPDDLPDNRCMALATLKSTEKRLGRNRERAEIYNTQIEAMVKRDAARKVSQDELVQYQGPKYYISHFEVMNPKSKSTPCRIVFNSSACYKGFSLNDYLAKGPSMLNKLLGVLLRFREGKSAFLGDISKMYHSIDIPLIDQMTHLFLWRNLESDCQPTTYAMTSVNMGDKPSATIAQVALRKTAEQAVEQFPAAARLIIENSYMDDIPGSTNSHEESLQMTDNIETILTPKNFIIKEWIFSGSAVTEAIPMAKELEEDESGEKERVLGIQWEPKRDVLEFQVNCPDTSNEEIITKRKMLSMINKIFDPLGLLTPFTVKLKLLMRTVWSVKPKIDWDDKVPKEVHNEWVSLMKEMAQTSDLAFNRSITPPESKGNPMLVIFSDGSIDAFGSVAYARWETENGFLSRLITAKSRMAPLKTIDIVRLELGGAVLSARLRSTIEKELNLEFCKTIHLVDSEIVKAMIHKESYGFNTYAANRIGEIQQTTDQSEWQWIPGKPWINVADMTTRGCEPAKLSGHLWESGPDFLKLPEEEWPSKKNPRTDLHLPEMKKKFVGTANIHTDEMLLNRFDLNRFSKWRLLVHTTARILKLYKRFKTGGTKKTEPNPVDLEEAENEWIKIAQRGLDLGKLQKLQPVEEKGVVVVGGRTERWMQATWNKQKFVLLPKDHPISPLIACYEHANGGHLGIQASIAKVRCRYWILGIKKMMREIVSQCTKCRKKLMKPCGQAMSPLPIERLQPCPPFTNVCIDYFGPYHIKGEVQKRIRGKCYGVLFTCLVVRAIHLDLAVDYSTDAFLQVLRRYASFRGWPKRIFSDGGTQLVGASRELREQISGLDWNQIESFSHKHCVEWKFSPGDAPWYNGTAEALVKSTKRAMNAAVGEAVLTFSELQTCLMEAAQLVNSRPIGSLPETPQDGTYLSPNDMLLGRATARTPQGPFKERTSFKYRLDFIQKIVSAFWTRWTREIFPNLVLQPKWHTIRRNLMKGDVVLVLDSNEIRGRWKLALVTEPIISEDGKVRKAKISYHTSNGGRQEIERAVQRLILLVASDEPSGGQECSDSNHLLSSDIIK